MCGGTFPQVFARSCNTAFAEIGDHARARDHGERGRSRSASTATCPSTCRAPAQSFFPSVQDFQNDVPNGVSPKLATSSFGQDEPAATPLQMNMAAAAVANDGVIMTPHVMAETRDSDGAVLDTYQPKPWLTVMTPETAATMTDFMVGVVQNGTAHCCLQLANGVQAAAKTGTAQLHPAGDPEASARVDHRLRAGRGAARRRDGVREGRRPRCPPGWAPPSPGRWPSRSSTTS